MPTFPYTSGQGALMQTFTQLRKGAPPKIDASYLQRFNIAPANESYIITILRFLGIVDEDGTRPEGGSNYLFGNDQAFQNGLEESIRRSYSQLFEEMKDAFQMDRESLTHWFRAADKTSALVGQRQATTFLTLGALAGHGDLPPVRTNNLKASPSVTSPAKKQKPPAAPTETKNRSSVSLESDAENVHIGSPPVARDVGLSVRIEVNLPAGGDAATYDAIFASIKKHLMS